MLRSTFLGLLVFLLLTSGAQAQKHYVRDQHLWLVVANQTRLAARWGTWTDLQVRFRDHFVQRQYQSLARVGLTYYLTDDVRLTGGYAYIYHHPEGTRTVGQPEHRPWQQVQWFTKFPQARLMQWVRLEERFRRTIAANERTDDFNFNFRTRYNVLLALPLTKRGFEPGSWQFVLNDELMVNFGREIRYNYFDQNRLFAGLGYQISPQAQVQAGYMHLFQQLPSGSDYRNQHTIRLTYFHNLDLRPTPPPPPAAPPTQP